MNRQNYREILGGLPIVNPTEEDMARVCPHLSSSEAVAAFRERERESSDVACPPLRIKGGFQIVSYQEEWEHEGETHPATLRWSYPRRTPSVYLHSDKAIKFAEENWGGELILDTWASVVTFYVQDPSDLDKGAFSKDCPKTKAVLYVAVNRDWNEIINDHTRPRSELIDDAIAEMTLDEILWHEIVGGRSGFTKFNCAYCGYGLSLKWCYGCGFRFRDDESRSGWDTPLTRKMVELLKASGHLFQKDPEEAWAKEKSKFDSWAKKA